MSGLVSPEQHRKAPHFLAGGGEMGARMRAFDWTSTPLGAPESWPQSLKTIIRVMLDSRYAMWMLWGPEYTFFCNDAYLPTVGIKRDWVLGARSDIVWEEVWSEVVPRLERVLKRGEATWDEALQLFLERSGFCEETYHTFSYSPIYDDDTDIKGMLCVVTEVTNRVIGERRLRALSDLSARAVTPETVEPICARLCRVLEEYPYDVAFAAIYRIDTKSNDAQRIACTRGLNDEVAPIILRAGDVNADRRKSRWPLAELIDSAVVQEINLQEMNIQKRAPLWSDPVSKALLVPFKDAAQRSLAGFILVGISPRRPLDDAYHSFLQLVAKQIGAAIAEAEALEAERQRAQALAELDRAKTLFFSNVSHEFRTPLTLMLAPIETLLNENTITPGARIQLELAHRNSLRLLKLVNSLLDFSRIEAGRIDARFEPTDFAAFTCDVASTFRSVIESAGLQFIVSCDDLQQPVFIDRDLWEKIILNLLSNAFKFTLRGAIEVRLRAQDDRAVFEVEDTGAGIPADELPRLFERFYRVEKTQSRTHEGSGIGLALVRELVELHGADIAVKSELGAGTVFRISLPFGHRHLPDDKIIHAATTTSLPHTAREFVEEAFRWLPDTPIDSTVAGVNTLAKADRRFEKTFGARILIVDDNSDMRAYMRSLLSPFYLVETLSDGVEALAAARRLRPDLILSDVMMPNLDGFGLLAALRADEQLRDVPVVLLSARAGEEARIEGFDAGADDYLAKPFSSREMLMRVGALLERQQQLRMADRQKDQFLAMLAHELRNPLAPIGNATELLARIIEPDASAQSAIQMIKRQMIHLTRLVDDLLDVSRITQGRIELQIDNIDISQVIAQAVETVEPLLLAKHQLLVTSSNYSQPMRIDGDITRLIQCVVNVLTNAIKYSDERSKIKLSVRAEGGFAIIEIADNGPGISPELLPHIFELFVQGERTLDRSQGGLGIGLSVAKGLIEMHGGSISAASSDFNIGSTFTLRLPLSQRHSSRAPERESLDSDTKKILIVDDNVDAVHSLAALLTHTGHSVETAVTGRDALQLLETFTPDVAILDIGLPEMDGYELAAAIRKMQHFSGIKLIALTGYGQASDRDKAQSAGFDRHLVKPIDFDALRKTLEDI